MEPNYPLPTRTYELVFCGDENFIESVYLDRKINDDEWECVFASHADE